MSRDSELQKDICVKATTSNGNSGNTDGKDDSSKRSIALCASCDRCRARKTKCDGKRPCGNCAAKYMKKHKLTRWVASEKLFRFVSIYKHRGFVLL